MLRHVETPDGVSIACEVSGQGPPLVLVHGAGSARWSFDAVRPHLEARSTVIRDAGDRAVLVGHSYGGLVAAGAAPLLDLPRLALYEPVMGGGLATRETVDRWERLIAEDERDTP